jgi:uncharacterized protein (TIGR00375 family)
VQTYYVDLHIHLGWAGEPGGGVKISAARDLTLANILAECRERKGIQMIGVIDAATEGSLADLQRLLSQGLVAERAGGGLAYGDGDLTLIPGAEVEVLHSRTRKPVHLLCYLPGVRELHAFADWQRSRVRNRQLSTQRHHDTTADDTVSFVGQLGGFVIPAHIFTPYKAALAAAPAIAEVVSPSLWGHLPAVELGLSSDTNLADRLPELGAFAFLSNSDAHSLGKIGREYNRVAMADPSFAELRKALDEREGRKVTANFGLDPRLGKYHRTYCVACDRRVEGEPPVNQCAVEPAHKVVEGVLDRICRLGGHAAPVPGRDRPPYRHQIPLQFVPGLGKGAMRKLLAAFGTEMGVLHEASATALREVVGDPLASLIVGAREGRLLIESGGGGLFGKVLGET